MSFDDHSSGGPWLNGYSVCMATRYAGGSPVTSMGHAIQPEKGPELLAITEPVRFRNRRLKAVGESFLRGDLR